MAGNGDISARRVAHFLQLRLDWYLAELDPHEHDESDEQRDRHAGQRRDAFHRHPATKLLLKHKKGPSSSIVNHLSCGSSPLNLILITADV